MVWRQTGAWYFYPRPPRGGRPVLFRICAVLCNFYPRPPRGGRPEPAGMFHNSLRISIHALREEGDWWNLSAAITRKVFLSTPSARRATGDSVHGLLTEPISIHALREEGDVVDAITSWEAAQFLSTPSARRATIQKCHRGCRRDISIHALREEGDNKLARASKKFIYFYPRPPRGGRPGCNAGHNLSDVFLSTPSARRATTARTMPEIILRISIHALREEGDVFTREDAARAAQFLSTPSARRATDRADDTVCRHKISIHALREEGDSHGNPGPI